MSRTASPNPDRVEYDCHGCFGKYWLPIESLAGEEIDGVPIEAFRIKNGLPCRCLQCALVMGTIEKLNHLVFMEPWLETEGKAGEPEKQAWEMEEKPADSGRGGSSAGENSGASSAGDGRTNEAAMAFREEQMAEMLWSAGKGFVDLEESSEEEEEKKGGEEEGEEEKKQ